MPVARSTGKEKENSMSNVQRCTRRRAWIVAGVSVFSYLLLTTTVQAGEVHLDALTSASSHQRFIVTYRDGSVQTIDAKAQESALKSAASAVPAKDGRELSLVKLRRLAVGPQLLKADRALDQAEAEILMRKIAAEPDVLSVEVDQLLRPTLTPNDSRLSEQWAFGTDTAGINVRSAWDQASGDGVVVAVIDTGITDHEDLNANILTGYDFISDTFVSRDNDERDDDPTDEGDWNSDSSECDVSDSSWHGTHVAGTIAAVTNNAIGVAGTAYNAKVIPVRVLGRCGGYTSDIADAIVWASGGTVSGVPDNANPAEVINLSLGGTGSCSSTYQNAIDGAVSRGTTVVVAAGNSSTNVSSSVPANCSNVIAVAATTSSREKASYSNYGTGIDISAPGSGILSTLNTGTTTQESASYASYDGTSMAAPHVAGVVALLQSAAPTPLTPAEVETVIKNSAASFSCTQGCGSGLIDANAAVTAAVTGDTGGDDGDGGGDGSVLSNGVAVADLAASRGESLNYSIDVPSGTSSLTVSISGGTGDADLYVRAGSEPTDSAYDCRPYKSGNSETCTISAASTGTYYIRIKAYRAFSGVTLLASY